MTTHLVLAMVSFEDDAGSATHIYDQIKAAMTNASVARIGEAGERTSYCTVGTENPDGSIAVTSQMHIDQFGIVREGSVDLTDPPPVWVQPLGSQDAYPVLNVRGEPARVTHNDVIWTNISPANTFAPGVFGWTPDE